MEETKKINGLTVLSASEGMMLRNGDSFSETVVLGRYDKAENYTEVSRDEYEAYVREHAAEHVGEGSSPGTEETPEPPHLVPTLSDAIAGKVAEINAYNNSAEVNGFKLGGKRMWLTLQERLAVTIALDAYEHNGEKMMTKMWDGTEYKMPTETYRDMLAKIEQYASECQNATEKHLQAVEKLTTVEEVCDYDYTTGYPEMIDFDASSSEGNTGSAEGGGEHGGKDSLVG
jgi:hypothetical protein